MSLTNKKQKDAAMAALMKKLGIERKHCNCPMCHKVVNLSSLSNHLDKCR